MFGHWTVPYVGMPYAEHTKDAPGFDCADLARLVLREVFGQEINIPFERDYSNMSAANKVVAMSDQVKRCMTDTVRPLEGRAPQDGDCAILIGRARMNHVGVCAIINDITYVLHNASAQRQVVLARVSDLSRFGLRIEGFYSWI